MSADHLLHVAPENGWPGLTLSCLPAGDHYCLMERECKCPCEMCTGDEDHEPDHWGCDRQEHDYSFDGLPPCESHIEHAAGTRDPEDHDWLFDHECNRPPHHAGPHMSWSGRRSWPSTATPSDGGEH